MKVNHRWSILCCFLLLTACAAQPAKPVHGAAFHPVHKSVKPRPTPSPTIGPITVRAERSRTAQVSIVVSSRKRKLYRILADSNDSRRAPSGTYTSHFTNPSVVFFNEHGGQMRATARTADADGASKIVTMHDNVYVVTADGSTLTCDQFVYDQLHDHLHGYGHVSVHTKQGDTLHGGSVTGDILMRRVHIDG